MYVHLADDNFLCVETFALRISKPQHFWLYYQLANPLTILPSRDTSDTLRYSNNDSAPLDTKVEPELGRLVHNVFHCLLLNSGCDNHAPESSGDVFTNVLSGLDVCALESWISQRLFDSIHALLHVCVSPFFRLLVRFWPMWCNHGHRIYHLSQLIFKALNNM
jgi:hypothetical protein